MNSRRFGRNEFPERISFECEDDLVRLIRKEREFERFKTALRHINGAVPELAEWTRSNAPALVSLASELEGLVQVVTFLKQHPRPDCFARELPLAVDTKFIERHKDILRRWLDLTLPSHTIRADEEHFERRYGLRYVEPLVLVRFLDPNVRIEFGFPCDVLAIPLHTVAGWGATDVRVFVVENKVNLLTLPPLRRTVALGGLGAASALLRYCPCSSEYPLTYWGDIDVEGFAILSNLRTFWPRVQSIMMDGQTLRALRTLCGSGTGASPEVPPHLTPSEEEAFRICSSENLRLEQERIPQSVVVDVLGRRGGS